MSEPSSRHYVIRGREVVPVDFLEWASWFESVDRGDRVVRQAHVCRGGPFVSTVFLGLDHNFLGIGPPLLFETMIFAGSRDGFQDRYATYAEAERGHARAMQLARAWRGGKVVKPRVLKRQAARSRKEAGR